MTINKEAFKALLELDERERTIEAREGYYKAYILSVVLAPLGIYYFIKYLFFSNGTNDDIKAGLISLLLTVLTCAIIDWSFSLFINSFSKNNPRSNELLQELITPANQKSLKDLVQ